MFCLNPVIFCFKKLIILFIQTECCPPSLCCLPFVDFIVNQHFYYRIDLPQMPLLDPSGSLGPPLWTSSCHCPLRPWLSSICSTQLFPRESLHLSGDPPGQALKRLQAVVPLSLIGPCILPAPLRGDRPQAPETAVHSAALAVSGLSVPGLQGAHKPLPAASLKALPSNGLDERAAPSSSPLLKNSHNTAFPKKTSSQNLRTLSAPLRWN